MGAAGAATFRIPSTHSILLTDAALYVMETQQPGAGSFSSVGSGVGRAAVAPAGAADDDGVAVAGASSRRKERPHIDHRASGVYALPAVERDSCDSIPRVLRNFIGL